MGLAFCVLFAWWFASGIFMMYWDFPSVSQGDRLDRSEAIDVSRIRLLPEEAFKRLNSDGSPAGVQLAMLDGRPAYRFTLAGRGRVGGAGGKAPTPRRRGFGGNQAIVYADDGSVQGEYSKEQLLRIASRWAARPASSAKAEEVTAVDQWTVQAGLRNLRPLWKYTFPDGQQVYVSGTSGEVVQYTTLGSRIGAELGPIPHWLYYTPLRVQQQLWSNLIIWTSGIGTVMALMGLIVGISLYSPSQRYRLDGAPTGIPYRGQKRLHMILGLFFGIVTCTWAFSGMLSMDPFPVQANRGLEDGRAGGERASPIGRIQAVLRAARFEMDDYAAKSPQMALMQLGNVKVKQLDFTSFAGEPLYLAALNSHETRIVPVGGNPRMEFDSNRIFDMISNAAKPYHLIEQSMLARYDAYYLDRHGERPLPVLFVRLSDPRHTQLYIDQRTGRIVGTHSDESSWVTRWLYHGLHSLDFPWLYNHRPAWDIVVLGLLLGGLSLCITSIILGGSLLRRKLTFRRRRESLTEAAGA